MMTLSRLNLASVEETVRWAWETGLDGIIFERFVPLGLGMGLSNQALLSKDWELALRTIARQAMSALTLKRA
jgi:hypothetical protein